MHTIFEIAATFTLLIFFSQMYFFSVNSQGVKKQSRCQRLGIVFTTIGIVAFVFKTVPVVSFGVVMIMFGLTLISKGLDRLDKSIYIDRYVDK